MDASNRRNRAIAEAAHWFARLQAEDMDRAEREQFVDWFRESHVHVAEMLRIAQVHGALEQCVRWAHIANIGSRSNDDTVIHLPPFARYGNQDEDPAVRIREQGPQIRDSSHAGEPGDGEGPMLAPCDDTLRRTDQAKRPGPVKHFLYAATVLLIVAAAIVLPKIRGQIIDTERGERREVVLGDGSVLQVDPETRLRVQYTDDVRRVFLVHGRALFRVAKNAHRPFLVQAEATTVRAVGTAFSVEQLEHGVTVTVAEGKVAVIRTAELPGPSNFEIPGSVSSTSGTSGHSSAHNPPSRLVSASAGRTEKRNGSGEGALLLNANQQVTVQRGGSAEPVREVDSHRELAWAEGRLIFRNDDVGKVVAEFNRYNRVQLSVTDSALANRPISGVFNASEPEAFIAFLQTVARVEIMRDGDNGITIGSVRSR